MGRTVIGVLYAMLMIVTIVGVDLMQVERVTGRLTWPKVLGGGAVTGAWEGAAVPAPGGLYRVFSARAR